MMRCRPGIAPKTEFGTVPGLVPLAQMRSLHSPGTQDTEPIPLENPLRPGQNGCRSAAAGACSGKACSGPVRVALSAGSCANRENGADHGL